MSLINGVVTTPAKNGTLGSQAGANADQIIFDTTLIAVNNGNLSTGEAGHDVFVGRTVILRRGLPDEETALITKVEVDDLKCTVHKDWVVAPVSGDTYDVAYFLFDAFGPVSPGAHFFNANQILQISDDTAFAYFCIVEGYGMQSNAQDLTTTGDIQVRNQGRFGIGVRASGKSISGGQLNLQTGESSQLDGFLGLDVQSGGEIQFNNLFIQASRDVMIQLDPGAKGAFRSVGIFSAWNMDLSGSAGLTLDGFTVEGRRNANDTILMDSLPTYKDMAMISCEAMINAAAGVETITIRGFLSIGNVKEIVVSADKTWIIVDPNPWNPTSARLDFGTGNTGEVLEKFSLDITVKDPAGVAIQNVRTYIDDETNNLLPTENKVGTDANGLASSDIKKRRFTFPVSGSFTTETFGAFKLRVMEYTKTPFETDLGVVTAAQVLGVTLINDAGITLSEAAADTVAGVVVTKPTNPDSVFDYDGGTTAFTVGQVVTGGTSGATGTLSEDTGDAVTGKLILTGRNAISFSDNEAITDPLGGAAVAHLVSPEQRFTWEVELASNSLSDTFHNLDSRAAKDSPTAIFLTMLLTRMRLIDLVGTDYSTATIEGEGVLLINRGAGKVTGMGDNSGGTFTPPTTVTLKVTATNQINKVQEGLNVRFQKTDKSLIATGTTDVNGVFTASFVHTGDVLSDIIVRGAAFEDKTAQKLITVNGFDIPIGMIPEDSAYRV